MKSEVGGLGVMPLHTITEMYGEQGLKERSDLELERFEPEQRIFIESARDLALNLHKTDRRDREPTNNHILRVGTRVIAASHYGVDDPEIGAGTFLHDTVEDHSKEISGLEDTRNEEYVQHAALQVIEGLFTAGTSRIVAALTNPSFDTTRNWHGEYHSKVKQSLLEEPKARPGKASDFTDNGVGVIYSLPERLLYFAGKYSPLVPIFREIIPLPDTPLSQRAREHIMGQLDLAEERFAAILR